MKIKAICRHEIVYKNGKSPLAIRFTHQRTHKTVSLGISVEPHYWDKNAEMITADCPERVALQSQIDNTLAGYRKKIQRLEALDIPVTFDTLFETDKGRHAGITIEDGFNAEIERLESLGKINSATKHKYALQVLNGYKPTSLAAADEVHPSEFTTYFRSVIAFGKIQIIESESERMYAASLLGARYNPGDDTGLQKELEKGLSHMLILRLDIEHLTGKEAIELVRKR